MKYQKQKHKYLMQSDMKIALFIFIDKETKEYFVCCVSCTTIYFTRAPQPLYLLNSIVKQSWLYANLKKSVL